MNPDTINADDLAWSLLTPDAAPTDLPPGFKGTVSNDVSQPVAVRPDGIVASAELVHELFGFDLTPVLVASNEVHPPTDTVKGQEVSQLLVAHPALAQYEGAR